MQAALAPQLLEQQLPLHRPYLVRTMLINSPRLDKRTLSAKLPLLDKILQVNSIWTMTKTSFSTNINNYFQVNQLPVHLEHQLLGLQLPLPLHCSDKLMLVSSLAKLRLSDKLLPLVKTLQVVLEWGRNKTPLVAPLENQHLGRPLLLPDLVSVLTPPKMPIRLVLLPLTNPLVVAYRLRRNLFCLVVALPSLILGLVLDCLRIHR